MPARTRRRSSASIRVYLEEMRGIAEGAGVDDADVLAINVRTEVMFAAKARAGGPSRLGECSAFAVTPARSADGHTLIGQNWDWLLHSADTVVVLEAEQPDRPDFVTVVEAGLLAKTGMNSSGIGLVTNALVSDADRGDPGSPVPRGAPRDPRRRDDLRRVRRVAAGVSVVVGQLPDRPPLTAGGEHRGGARRLRRTLPDVPRRGAAARTRTTSSRTGCTGSDVGLWVMPDSPFRLDRLRAQTGSAPSLSLKDFRQALADHANHPSGICCHPDERWRSARTGGDGRVGPDGSRREPDVARRGTAVHPLRIASWTTRRSWRSRPLCPRHRPDAAGPAGIVRAVDERPSLEAIVLYLDPSGIRHVYPHGRETLRGPWDPDLDPTESIVDAVAGVGLAPVMVHSTSWRVVRRQVVLTFLVVIDPPGSLPELVRGRAGDARGARARPRDRRAPGGAPVPGGGARPSAPRMARHGGSRRSTRPSRSGPARSATTRPSRSARSVTTRLEGLGRVTGWRSPISGVATSPTPN